MKWPALAATIALAGCGGGGGGGGSIVHGKGDTASFSVGGRTVTVKESGTAKVRIDGAPEMNYDGPVGCRGQFFTADLGNSLNAYFHYGSQDALLLIGSELHTLGGKPEQHGSQLRWQTTSGDQQIDIRASCPPPPAGPRLAHAKVPDACSVLTPALAREILGGPAKRTRSGLENPELSYCTFHRRDNNDQIQVSVATSREIESLISWEAQPAVPGVGDAAHGGSSGLAVKQGDLALEIVMEGSNGDAAAEVAAARKLLPRLG